MKIMSIKILTAWKNDYGMLGGKKYYAKYLGNVLTM